MDVLVYQAAQNAIAAANAAKASADAATSAANTAGSKADAATSAAQTAGTNAVNAANSVYNRMVENRTATSGVANTTISSGATVTVVSLGACLVTGILVWVRLSSATDVTITLVIDGTSYADGEKHFTGNSGNELEIPIPGILKCNSSFQLKIGTASGDAAAYIGARVNYVA